MITFLQGSMRLTGLPLERGIGKLGGGLQLNPFCTVLFGFGGFLVAVDGTRALSMLSTCYTTELHPQPMVQFLYDVCVFKLKEKD